jgi:tetratricopeptide (TPR) repeat protein
LPANKRINARVGLVDVTPTVLQVAGITIPAPIQGESLLGMMKQASLNPQGKTSEASSRPQSLPIPDRPLYAETDYPRRAFGWSPLRALRVSKYLFVKAPERELYDQVADPAASRNLATASPAVSDTLAAQVDDFRSKTSSVGSSNSAPALDPQQAAQLSALGYIASDTGAPGGKANEEQRVDPKFKIEIANALHDAMLDVEEAHYAEAIPKLQKVLADQPQMGIAQMHLGTAYTRLKDYKAALPPLLKAVELQPDSGMAHYELGLALFETGDWPSAAPQFEAAVARAPRWADAQFSLAAVFARIDRVPEAMDHLATTLELNSDHFRANLLRGRILTLQGDPASALPNLQKAVRLEPKSFEAHQFLADAYAQLGQESNAARERAEATRLKTPSP